MTAFQFIVTSVLTLIGLFLAYSFNRQQRLKIAEQRIDAYRKLWSVMETARPSRLKPPESAGPMSADEARTLYKEMTAWYFENGNGMMLTAPTRDMYLEAKRRVGAYSSDSSAGAPSGDAGERLIDDLSLLRTQMKLDLRIYGVIYPKLEEGDEDFIRASKLNPASWGRPLSHRLRIRRPGSNGQTPEPGKPGEGGTTTPMADG